MPPKPAKDAKEKPKPLDKRMAANSGKEEISHWNISELKQNLQEDSAVLEQTLRDANKLLGESAGIPMVDIKGQVSKEAQLKKLKELIPESDLAAEIASNRDAFSTGTSEGGGAGGQSRIDVSSGMFMTELDVSSVTNTPSLVGPVQARMSEELALRLQVLADVIGRDATQIFRLTIQSDIDQVCRMARKDEQSKLKKVNTSQGAAGRGASEEMEAQLLEQEALKVAAQEQLAALKDSMRNQSQRFAELQAKTALLDASSQEFSEKIKKSEAEAKALREELLAAQHKTRVEEAERHKLVLSLLAFLIQKYKC